jgi:hypothetical protein
VPYQIADPSRFGIESDIPGQRRVAQLGESIDCHTDAEQMRDPAPHRFR